MLGIIGAMEMEIAALKQDMKDVHVVKKAGMSFFKGKIYDKDVVIVESGIGKVNAGICTQILIDVFNIDAVINTGVAGSLNNNINICDIVVSTKAQQHDMDVTALGYERGIIPGMKESEFMADKRLIELAKCSVKKAGLDINVFEGKIVSGDRFIGTIEEKKYLRETFDGDCAEMEGAAIAHVARLNEVPFLIIRAISDKADNGAEMDYPEFEKRAAENSIKLMKCIIKKY